MKGRIAILSQENKISIAQAILADYKIDAHPHMGTIKRSGPIAYDEILDLVAEIASGIDVHGKTPMHVLWPLDTGRKFSIDVNIEFLRARLRIGDRNIIAEAVLQLWARGDDVARRGSTIRILAERASDLLGYSDDSGSMAFDLITRCSTPMRIDFT